MSKKLQIWKPEKETDDQYNDKNIILMKEPKPLLRLLQPKAKTPALTFFRTLILFFYFAVSSNAASLARIKDISRIAGVEDMKLIGYGIVVGLSSTGDKDLEITRQTVANLVENFNISISSDDIKSKNVAAVLVTGSAHPFHQEGDKVNIKVSSIGDATSLEGGILLMTPLLNPNGKFYALGQGSITLGGFSAGGGGAGGSQVTKNHTTTGLIPSGAILRHSDNVKFHNNGIVRLLLRHPDFTTAERMALAINKEFGGIAVAQSASTVAVKIPEEQIEIGQETTFVAGLERITVTPDNQAKIIINERTGTIVMGGDVHIKEAVIAHGNLTVTIKETLHPSHPKNLFLGRGAGEDIKSLETPDVITTVQEEKASVLLVPTTTTVRELADTINLMGATPRDLISILEALHKLGAIQMELVAM